MNDGLAVEAGATVDLHQLRELCAHLHASAVRIAAASGRWATEDPTPGWAPRWAACCALQSRIADAWAERCPSFAGVEAQDWCATARAQPSDISDMLEATGPDETDRAEVLVERVLPEMIAVIERLERSVDARLDAPTHQLATTCRDQLRALAASLR